MVRGGHVLEIGWKLDWEAAGGSPRKMHITALGTGDGKGGIWMHG